MRESRKLRPRQIRLFEALESRFLLSADLTGAFTGTILSALPPQGTNRLSVLVSNVGNVAATGTATITLFASSDKILDGNDTALGARIVKLSLAAGHSVTELLSFPSPATLTSGPYYILADVVGSAAIADANTANNFAATTATVQITKPIVDLTGAFGPTLTLPVSDISGDNHTMTVPVVVTNQGNVPVPAGQKISIEIDAFNGTTTTPVKTFTLQSVSLLGVGKSKTFKETLALPAGLATGTYHLVATVDSSAAVASDPNRSNNVATSSGATGTISVTKGYVDLTDAITRMPSSTINIRSSSAKASFSVVVTNHGNITAKGNLNFKYYLSTDQTLSAADPLVFNGSQAISINPGKSSTITLAATLGPNTPTGGLYGLVRINSDNQFAESDTTNDLGASASKVTIHNAAVPAGPWILGGLKTDANAVILGQAALIHFSVQVSEPTPNSVVEVDEVNAQGTIIGKITDLYDTGSAAVGDLVAGDGIFNGVSSIEIDAAGQRHFQAVLTDSTLTHNQHTALVAITGVAAPTNAQLQQDATTDSAVNAAGAQLFGAKDSPTKVISHLKTLLQADANVIHASIVTSPTMITWETSDGYLYGFDTTEFTASGTLGAPGATALSPMSVLHPADTGTADNGGLALVLSPFASSLSAWDPSSAIESMLANDGYTVTYLTDQSVALSSFQNLGQYNAVALYGHGALLPGGQGGEVFYTSLSPTLLSQAANAWDLLTHRVIILNNYFTITPAFVSAYSGSMDGTIVFAAACNSAYDSQMADAFLGNGAAAYLGFTHVVKAAFAAGKETDTFSTLLQADNNTVGDIPGLFVDHDANNPPAYFTMYGDINATLPQPTLLKNNELYVNYNWPQTQTDLDSNTTFLGSSAGWNLAGSPYINWSGDDTSSGGSETSLVSLYNAWKAGAWSGSTSVTAGADWYTPSNGVGPAYVTIGLEDLHTGKITHAQSFVVYPGQEDSGASTVVKTIAVSLTGNPLDPTVHIAVSWRRRATPAARSCRLPRPACPCGARARMV